MELSPRPAAVQCGSRAISPVWPSGSGGLSQVDPAESGERTGLEILRRVEALKIPWERILLDEIQAEQTLRRYVEDVAEMPLVSRLSVLSFSFLKSWRARDQIQALSCAARGASLRSAMSQLRLVFRHLAGQPDRGQAAFAGHLWFAHQRVLLLQRVCRAARRSRGTTAERMAFICSTTRCSFDDAAWALCREDSPRPGHRLDAAIQKVREEGFQIPREPTEARSFAELRRIVRGSRHPVLRRRPRKRSSDGVTVPPRVGLPSDAV
jgi:hypothetical protein